jgi:hypothetical protein
VLVFRSKKLDGDVTRRTGIPITTAARTLVDLAPGLDARRLGRALREAIRLRHTTARRVLDALDRHRGRRGTRPLRELATRYSALPYSRTRSDAEGRALELLHDAGVELPRVNVTVAGEGGRAQGACLARGRVLGAAGAERRGVRRGSPIPGRRAPVTG